MWGHVWYKNLCNYLWGIIDVAFVSLVVNCFCMNVRLTMPRARSRCMNKTCYGQNSFDTVSVQSPHITRRTCREQSRLWRTESSAQNFSLSLFLSLSLSLSLSLFLSLSFGQVLATLKTYECKRQINCWNNEMESFPWQINYRFE